MSVDSGELASILIPTRGRAQQLARLIQSLHTSGHLDAAEAIVVDNNRAGSPDSDSVKTLAARYGTAWTAGPGPKSVALNTAAGLSRARYLVFLDDDTIVDNPSWLRNLIAGFVGNVGYVAGDVRALELHTDVQRAWERKGGLSKGRVCVEMTPPRRRSTRHAWQLKRVAAGANCALPRAVFQEIGGFCERLGPGTPTGAGETVEIVDRVLRAGYRARYTPEAHVSHAHPEDAVDLRAKLRGYARGDSALALHLARSRGDLGAALWALGGHQLYRLRNLILAAAGHYPLPTSWACASLIGSLEGPLLYLASLPRGSRNLQGTAEPADRARSG